MWWHDACTRSWYNKEVKNSNVILTQKEKKIALLRVAVCTRRNAMSAWTFVHERNARTTHAYRDYSDKKKTNHIGIYPKIIHEKHDRWIHEDKNNVDFL